MKTLGLSHLLQILTCILLLTPSFSKDDRKIYIVYMGEYPKGMELTESLHTTMVQSAISRKLAPDTLVHSYKSFNGFVARLTKEESERMKRLDDVVSVIPNRVHSIQTSRSWDFLGFPENVQRTKEESNTIVGVLDTGIWPNSSSFTDEGFGPPPEKWKGTCHNFTCNNKIIGAKYFRLGGVFPQGDLISPTDTSGHGSHCASTAAGNPVRNANLFGLGLGTARGGVPLARIAVYKVCWTNGCETADVLAGFDAAIMDGVDIISLSVGYGEVIYPNYFEDDFAIGAFHAMKRGILTSQAAGNLGPNPYTMSNLAPWFISVAASTIDRKFLTNLQLGNGQIFKGISVNTFSPTQKSYPLIYGGDAPAAVFNSSVSKFCYENTLDRALVKGKIVLCDAVTPSFPYFGYAGFASGAAGLIFIFPSTAPLVVAVVYALPAISITASDGNTVLSYLRSTSNPAATIFKSYEGKDSSAPYIAPFSSRGPNKVTPNILKPDIAAPGVEILAAWSPISPISGVKGDRRVSNFNIIYGTSMACPHVTAAAVYVKSFHPNWSPAAIKSALMTTATPMNPALNVEAEFAYGVGQINPLKAVNPGLVYDAGESDYISFLCGQGYNSSSLQKITDDNSTCTSANKGSVFNLNLPSFALSTPRSSYNNVTFGRTVTNVGSATSTYKATITAHPSSLNVQVLPSVLAFSSLGQRLSFTLKIEGSINTGLVSFSLIWDDGTFNVRSPVVVYVP
ncbi:cucumisin-like [Vigna radiata var. radiata]|uniref:Cucumisin-like n=1 Tax=Vigna radiata var. radiata TaxID=3916 RepID=A0A1S3UCN6_VIGRR|nr:cucumisin-like [Vigna radiata var. radiata]XP_014503788.1 cucumisin-like [Vigna radiata var. radiata]XP_014503789.1 cucumisin-like [Vigna radiata var. radiata]